MKLIIGLGNPGEKYRQTRHNVGRMLVELFASDLHARFKKKSTLDSHAVETKCGDIPVVLAYPNSYMNQSGTAVKKLSLFFGIDPSKELLIAVDDVALPIGSLRLRQSGSAGGHNGLKSVEELLETTEYSRLRLGIGPAVQDEAPLSDFVLGKLGPEEFSALIPAMEKGVRALRLWLTEPIERVMSAINSG